MSNQLTFTVTIRADSSRPSLAHFAEQLRKAVYPVRNDAISHGNGDVLVKIDESFTRVCPTCQALGSDWKDFLHDPVETGCKAPLEHHDAPHD